MKRILIFSLAYYPHVGGAEVALKEITDRISDIEFHMLTLQFGNDPAEEKLGNIFVHRVPGGSSYLSKMLFILRAARHAHVLHQKLHFDLLWAMMSYMLLPIVFARLGVAYVLTLQEGDPFSHVFKRSIILPFLPLLRAGFREAAAVTAISTYLARWAREMGYRGDIAVVPNGVDPARFSVSHIGAPGATLVTVSRLVRKNAVDDIIHAVARLPHARLRIYGAGPEEAALKKLVHELAVLNRVEFLGYVDHAELPQALAECDIFVRPSRSEGMGNAFIEAMAAGLPVVGTREGGIADFLTHHETGWVVEKDSPKEIAEAVQDILAHPETVKTVTENAKKLVREKYSWDTIAGQMRSLFGTIGV